MCDTLGSRENICGILILKPTIIYLLSGVEQNNIRSHNTLHYGAKATLRGRTSHASTFNSAAAPVVISYISSEENSKISKLGKLKAMKHKRIVQPITRTEMVRTPNPLVNNVFVALTSVDHT
jgi:hypothetical protein